MKRQLENVNVTDHGMYQYENLCLSWEFDGARYHVWENSTNVLYKNPPLAIQHHEPGFFHARKLDPASKVNQAMILEARSIARRDDLYKKAAITKEEKAHAEKMAQLGAIATRRKHDAGPELYDALKAALVYIGPTSKPAPDELYMQIESAIDKAENGERQP